MSDYEYVYKAAQWLEDPDRGGTCLHDLRRAQEIVREHHPYAARVVINLARSYLDGWPVPARSAKPLAAYLDELGRYLEGRITHEMLQVAEAVYAEHVRVFP